MFTDIHTTTAKTISITFGITSKQMSSTKRITTERKINATTTKLSKIENYTSEVLTS